jgi:hypothetical protein
MTGGPSGAAKLKPFKMLLDAGKREIAVIRLKQFVKKYPGTMAAEEAKKLINQQRDK